MSEELLHHRVRWVRDGAVARIELASPDTRNALDGNMALGLGEATTRRLAGAADGTLRAALLTAQGPVFSVGGDLRWPWSLPTPVLSTPTPDPPLHPGHAAEPKWDGYRALLGRWTGDRVLEHAAHQAHGPTRPATERRSPSSHAS